MSKRHKVIPLIVEPHGEKSGFLINAKIKVHISFTVTANAKLISDCTGRFMSYLVGNPEDQFSCITYLLCG